jgi:hypothetical protein
MSDIEAIKARHEQDATGCALARIEECHADRATLLSALTASEARAKAAEELIRVLLENDPMEYIADAG